MKHGKCITIRQRVKLGHTCCQICCLTILTYAPCAVQAQVVVLELAHWFISNFNYNISEHCCLCQIYMLTCAYEQ